MTKRLPARPRSLTARLIFTLLGAFLAGALVYIGAHGLSDAGVARWYMNGDAVAARNRAHMESLQSYVTENSVASTDSAAIEAWARAEKDSSVIVYRAGDSPYESGWWGTDVILDDVEQADISELGYGFFPLTFTDGVFQVAVCDVSENYLYSAAQVASLLLALLVFICIALAFFSRTTRRIVRLSEAVNAVSGGLNDGELPAQGDDEIARLAQDVNHMRDAIAERARGEQTAWQANSDLITALSHDIRNPLTSLIGYLELLEMERERLPEDAQGYVRSSLDKAYRLKYLTGGMFRYFLVFSREEQDLNLESYDAQILLEQLVGEYMVELRGQGWRVNTVPLQTPCRVRTDVEMLRRVMENLVSNLNKYADPAQPLSVLAEADGGALHLCVANRVKTRTAPVESNRIGLRTCEAILHQLGGSFQTHSDADGFTAELILPLEQ